MTLQRLITIAAILVLTAACQPSDSGSSESGADSSGSGATPASSAQRESSPETPDAVADRDVLAERLPYAEVADELVYGYFAFPTDMIEPLPAVIIIHEWWGLDEHIQTVAESLAAQGYIVLAVDLFNGDTATTVDAARTLVQRGLENADQLEDNIRQAHDFITMTAGAPKVATVGWGFGGGWSLNAAISLSDQLDAAVIYYGQVTDDEDQLRQMTAPVLGHFGSRDVVITPESVAAFEAAMGRLRKDYEVHSYRDARHAFSNPSASAYDAGQANEAWQRTLAFLEQRLASDED
ncbi:MAG: dienelactone hydrolase family protein [Pseudomonadota bacterium]